MYNFKNCCIFAVAKQKDKIMTQDKMAFTRLNEERVRKAIEDNPWIIELCFRPRTQEESLIMTEWIDYTQNCDSDSKDLCELILFIKQNYHERRKAKRIW